MKSLMIFAMMVATIAIPTGARASETVSYVYDELGRVRTVTHAGSVNNGLQQSYAHDPADNRSSVTVTGARLYGPSSTVVMPMLGGVLISNGPSGS